MWGGQLEAAGAPEAAACCFLQSGAPAAAAAALARRGTAGAIAAAAEIAAAAAAVADPAAGSGGSGKVAELRQLAQQLQARAAAAAGSGDSTGADSAAAADAHMPVETGTSQLGPTGALEAPVVVVSSGASAVGAAAIVAAPATTEAEAAPEAAATAGHVKGGLSNGTGDPAAAVACAAERETIPMSRALAMRPWQLPGYRAAASAAPGASSGGVEGAMTTAFERHRYSRDQLLGVCGGMAVGKAPGQAFVAADKACARAAELDILLPELPPPPPPPLALP